MAAQPEAVARQAFQSFPQLSQPIVDENGYASLPLTRLLITMWQKLGGALTTVQNTALVQQASVGAGAPLTATNAQTGAPIGTILLTDDLAGGPAQPQSLGASPFEFEATDKIGTLVVSSGQVEISRDAGATWYIAGLAGSALPLLSGDLARVTWFNSAPTVVFLPWS